MRKFVACIFVAVSLLPLYLKAQHSVTFFEEHIDFSIDNKYFNINGIYSFYNNSNEIVNQDILFPFAVKSSLIDSIRVINLNSMKALSFSKLDHAISFSLLLQPKDTLDINIFYRQKSSNKNTYIITTTRMWGRPLDKAIYRLTAPKDMDVHSFSYKPDTMRILDEKKIYQWDKYHFSPQSDFEFEIKGIE